MLDVFTAPFSRTATSATFVPPGHQTWTLRTAYIEVSRGVGGAPDRGYRLTVTDGTTTVAQVGADDAGTEPGATSITWANAAQGAVTAGPVGTVVASMANVIVPAGYELILEIVNPAAGDTLDVAAIWADYVDAQ